MRYMICALVLIGLICILPAAASGAEKIAYVSRPQTCEEISVMNGDGTGHVQLTSDTCYDERPAWSPDGTRIAFGHSYWSSPGMDAMEIYVMHADGTERVRLTVNDAYDSLPAWSPDGTRIAFASRRDGNGEIYVMNADGSRQTRLTFGTAEDLSPAWSPDGTRIAFASERDGNWEIYVMNADGSRQTRLTRNAAADGDPAWSPDGSRVAFASKRNGNSEIYVMRADGSRQVRLTTNTFDDTTPAWSPDGTRIAFTSCRPPFIEIYVMNAVGTGERSLTAQSGSLACTMPAWLDAATIVPTPPVVRTVTVPEVPVAVKGPVSVTASFTDAGNPETHTATWTWGDGSTSTGTVAGSAVAGAHTYTSAGVYRVSVTVTDGGGASGVGAASTFVVIYDTKGGFVTGGGWITSPAGAYAANASLTGPAAFGFTSRYATGSSRKGSGTAVLQGKAEFLFGLGDLNFQSTSFESLVAGGAKATLRGTGTVNGKGAYGFQLSVVDGQQRGGNGTDRFRIRIWDRVTGRTIYDNQVGAGDTADPATGISGGAITIATS